MSGDVVESSGFEVLSGDTTQDAIQNAAAFLVLKHDVLLRRRGRIGEPVHVFLRLAAGTRVPLLFVYDDPTDPLPNLCAWAGWPEFFWLGRGEVEYSHE